MWIPTFLNTRLDLCLHTAYKSLVSHRIVLYCVVVGRRSLSSIRLGASDCLGELQHLLTSPEADADERRALALVAFPIVWDDAFRVLAGYQVGSRYYSLLSAF